MKLKTKKIYLIGILLSTFLIVGIINITIGEKNIIKTNPDNSELHTASLYSLFLGSSESDTGFSRLRVGMGRSSLDILNGLIVGENNTVDSLVNLVVIGGGKSNEVSSNNAGIGGGLGNRIMGENGAIGGGRKNSGSGTIGGGERNKASAFSVVVGGFYNDADNGGVVLGGKNNKSLGENAWVLGSESKGESNTFAWNADAKADSARIDASGGVLIGTYTPVSGVSLVVSGAIKIGSGSLSDTGGILVDGNGCIRLSEGDVSHVLGSKSESECEVSTGCQFGKIMLHNGDKVTSYSGSYALNCETVKQTVKCINGMFYDSGNKPVHNVYPNCYNLSTDVQLYLTEGRKLCQKLPQGAVWTTGQYYYSTGGNKDPFYDPSASGSEPCSFKCIVGTYDSSTKKCH